MITRLKLALCFIVAGIVAGHAVGYGLAFPDAELRAHMLAESGHQWLGLGAALAAAGLIGGSCGAYARARNGGRAVAARPYRFFTIAALQTVGFVVVEFAERLQSGHSLGETWVELTSSNLLVLGLAAQLVLAAVVCCVWRGVTRLAAYRPQFVQAVRHTPGAPSAFGAVAARVASDVYASAGGARAPPATMS